MPLLTTTLADGFWAPRCEQLRTHTLPVMLERLEAQGVVDNFRRLTGAADVARQALHFSDSDLYKWIEAAALAGRLDLAEPVVDLVVAAQRPDGYLHTYYDTDVGPSRYRDLDTGHELYCAGHLVEAALAHAEASGTDRLLDAAVRLADHVVGTFGPGKDERTDAHPELELALARLAAATGDRRYLDHARWTIEQRLRVRGGDVTTWRLGGHAVRALYFASGITEVALADGDARYADAARRAFDDLLDRHSYPTGAVGGRWLGEAVGRPYELPDSRAYAESCAAVAAVHFCERIWRLTGDPRARDQIELLLFNAVPCGVGSTGDTWFYSQPQAVPEVATETNLWAAPFDYGEAMALAWFPARRHRWFAVPCCPPNLARLFASVDRLVASAGASGDLLVHVPIACHIAGAGWDVHIDGSYPDAGTLAIRVADAPADASLRVRMPGWAGGSGYVDLPEDGHVTIPIDWTWWETDRRVEPGAATVHLRRGPVVYCLEGGDAPGCDLRDLVVDPHRAPADAFSVRFRDAGLPLHRPYAPADALQPAEVHPRRYCDWASGEPTTMRIRFPVVDRA